MQKLISHTGQFSIVYSDYVAITGDACAAQILASFEHWTLDRIKDSEFNGDRWIYISLVGIVDSLCGTFKRNKVIESLKILRIKGFIESKSSYDPMDKTLLYKFNTENVQSAINKLSKSGGAV
jgi:hypothetical protein